jgi:molybdenum cofactor biosynthesis enzyme MoaA
MKKYNYNFTVVTPGGCNADCSFCTDKMNYKMSKNYFENLYNIVFSKKLPHQFDQVSISGGEPTNSKHLHSILALLGVAREQGIFNKVVLTTNGAKLLDHVHAIGDNVNHLNISRHGIGFDKNVEVFKTKDIASDEVIKTAAITLGKRGVDINFNHVYDDTEGFDDKYVLDYIEYAKSLGVTKVTFRHDQNKNQLSQTKLEKYFEDYKIVEEGSCQVCRNHTILVSGMYVSFKSSFAEPSNYLGEMYELIYHPSGKLTTDWEGQKEYSSPSIKPDFDLIYRTYPVSSGSGGCGSGGCGK